MAAHNKTFPWASYYEDYKYFEENMKKHGSVLSMTPCGDGLYEIKRTKGDVLRVFICECYAFGVAEYMETVERLGPVDVVVINSMWCGYTPEAKWYCRDSNVGLFKIGEFMGALRHDHYWRYLTNDEEEDFKKKGWL